MIACLDPFGFLGVSPFQSRQSLRVVSTTQGRGASVPNLLSLALEKVPHGGARCTYTRFGISRRVLRLSFPCGVVRSRSNMHSHSRCSVPAWWSMPHARTPHARISLDSLPVPAKISKMKGAPPRSSSIALSHRTAAGTWGLSA